MEDPESDGVGLNPWIGEFENGADKCDSEGEGGIDGLKLDITSEENDIPVLAEA